MGLAVERHHVVLAVRIEADVAHQNEIIVTAGLGEGAVQHLYGALPVSLIDLLVGAYHALGRFQQTLATRVIAGVSNQRAYGSFGLLARRPRLNRSGRRPYMVGKALLRPRLYVGDLRVHDGSLRSTGTQGTGCVTGLAASVNRSGPILDP